MSSSAIQPTASSVPAVGTASGWTRPSVVVAALFVFGLAIAGYLGTELTDSESTVASWISNLGQLATALLATGGAAIAYRRSTGHQRRSWLLVAFACGARWIVELIAAPPVASSAVAS